MSDQIPADADPFELWATLPVSDARGLLEKFEQEGIRFQIATEQAQIENMDAFTASAGGSFGAGVEIQIFTRRDEAERVERIWKDFCGFAS